MEAASLATNHISPLIVMVLTVPNSGFEKMFTLPFSLAGAEINKLSFVISGLITTFAIKHRLVIANILISRESRKHPCPGLDRDVC